MTPVTVIHQVPEHDTGRHTGQPGQHCADQWQPHPEQAASHRGQHHYQHDDLDDGDHNPVLLPCLEPRCGRAYRRAGRPVMNKMDR